MSLSICLLSVDTSRGRRPSRPPGLSWGSNARSMLQPWCVSKSVFHDHHCFLVYFILYKEATLGHPNVMSAYESVSSYKHIIVLPQYVGCRYVFQLENSVVLSSRLLKNLQFHLEYYKVYMYVHVYNIGCIQSC